MVKVMCCSMCMPTLTLAYIEIPPLVHHSTTMSPRNQLIDRPIGQASPRLRRRSSPPR